MRVSKGLLRQRWCVRVELILLLPRQLLSFFFTVLYSLFSFCSSAKQPSILPEIREVLICIHCLASISHLSGITTDVPAGDKSDKTRKTKTAEAFCIIFIPEDGKSDLWRMKR